MEIKLYMIGKTEMPFVEQGLEEFGTRVGRYVKFSMQVLTLPRQMARLPATDLKRKEGELILAAMAKESFNVILDEHGMELSSRDFAEYLQKRMNHVSGSICFYIGGAYGFSEEVKNRADHSISLSAMTFSHQLIRLIFLEQFYRALTILRNEPYHND